MSHICYWMSLVHYRFELAKFWVENGENPRPEHAKTQKFAALCLNKGARRPEVRELALGAHLLAPGAPDSAIFELFCARVLGASPVGVRCDRVETYFRCFHIFYNWNKHDFIKT
jgi:hypothetical protein